MPHEKDRELGEFWLRIQDVPEDSAMDVAYNPVADVSLGERV